MTKAPGFTASRERHDGMALGAGILGAFNAGVRVRWEELEAYWKAPKPSTLSFQNPNSLIPRSSSTLKPWNDLLVTLKLQLLSCLKAVLTCGP